MNDGFLLKSKLLPGAKGLDADKLLDFLSLLSHPDKAQATQEMQR